MSNSDKVYIVTGSSSGIGVGIAECLVKNGAKKVVLVARRKDRLEEVAKSLKSLGAKEVLVMPKDLSNLSECPVIIQETIKKFGRLDVLVNNAGYTSLNKPLISTSDKEALDMFTLNFMASFALAREALPHIRKTKGNIIFISSVGATLAFPRSGIYGATKAAMNSMAKNMALEEAEHGVRINIVSPGAIVSEIAKGSGFFDHMSDDEFKGMMSKMQPLAKTGMPEDIGKAVAFLSSNDWAPFATGTELIIDGGAMLKPPSLDV